MIKGCGDSSMPSGGSMDKHKEKKKKEQQKWSGKMSGDMMKGTAPRGEKDAKR
jgi:hypothetical protein